jgi:hypothetical protein
MTPEEIEAIKAAAWLEGYDYCNSEARGYDTAAGRDAEERAYMRLLNPYDPMTLEQYKKEVTP